MGRRGHRGGPPGGGRLATARGGLGGVGGTAGRRPGHESAGGVRGDTCLGHRHGRDDAEHRPAPGVRP
ncbi:hypothetical protein FNX48_019485 [Streptomyces sp. IF17]|nr:hypothetical protein [Streptomyces alkaliphilus]